MSQNKYASDIKLGERYKDAQTGIEGVATGIVFYQYGCERVDIELVVTGEVKVYAFDAPRLTHIATGQQAKTTRTGGPAKESAGMRRGPVAR